VPEDPQPNPRPLRKEKTQKLPTDAIVAASRDKLLDQHRASITWGLIALLAFTLLLHAGLTIWASNTSTEAVKNIADVFNIWVPVLSGLASSAITWFFTKQR
jgi:hypothetical protein